MEKAEKSLNVMLGSINYTKDSIGSLTALSQDEKYIQMIDSDYGFSIAKKLLEFKTNSNGFRLAGTPAEGAAADWILQEMNRIGLKDVTKEGFPVDAWEFNGAEVKVISPNRTSAPMEAGSFTCLKGTPPDGITGGVVYVGDGTKQNYEGLNVKDKIVLIDTDSYHSYWYNTIFGQAEARGAKAIIATVVGTGPGTYNDDLITTQDVQGRISIPAVMLTKKDGDQLRALLNDNLSLVVSIKADIKITRNGEAHYVYGKIIGRNPGRYIIVGGHYDAYWDGFLDNASSLGSQLTMAKAMIDSGYQPESTIIFITNGAEEYGIADTYFDYCTGAHAIIKNHPEWVSNTMIYNNFELTAISQTQKFLVVGSPCYSEIFSELLTTMNLPNDFSFIPISMSGADHTVFSKSGIPTYMNVCTHFGGDDSESMENYDHTQHDNTERYDAAVFDFNNKIYGLINMIFDKMLIAPLNFTFCTANYWNEVEQFALKELYPRFTEMDSAIKRFHEKANKVYGLAVKANQLFQMLKEHQPSEVALEALYDMGWVDSQSLLKINKKLQDNIYKFNAFTDVIYGHIQPYNYVTAIESLVANLKTGHVGDSLEGIESLYNNYLIQSFDKEVYEKTAIEAFAPSVPQSWGTGQMLPFPNMYDVITSIHDKVQKGDKNFGAEITVLQRIRNEQYSILVQTLDNELDTIQSASEIMDEIKIQRVIDAENKLLRELHNSQIRE